MTNPPPHSWQEERFSTMTAFLRVSSIAAFVLAIGGLGLPGDTGRAAGWALILLFAGLPAVRIAWLVGRWHRRGDTPFARRGLVLLGVLASAGVIAVL